VVCNAGPQLRVFLGRGCVLYKARALGQQLQVRPFEKQEVIIFLPNIICACDTHDVSRRETLYNVAMQCQRRDLL